MDFANNEELATKIQSLRVHVESKRYHHQCIGMGGRMDALQATVLNVKLKYYIKDLKLKQKVAEKYNKEFKINNSKLMIPVIVDERTSARTQYTVRVENRDEVQAKLKDTGMPTAVYYPVPLDLQECFAYLGYKKGDFPVSEIVSDEIMSILINSYLTKEEISYI